jgi:hypothetical protein
MNADSVVMAFSDSPVLRETLSVLLENECRLDFVNTPGDASDPLDADLALVATRAPAPLLHSLRARWPALPIIAVQVDQRARLAPASVPAMRIQTVPLEPHAIRSAVLDNLVHSADATLRSLLSLITETLGVELTYARAALRSFSALYAATAGPATHAIVAAVMREQSFVLEEMMDCLEALQARPRAPALSADFIPAMGRALEREDLLATRRGMWCHCTVEAWGRSCPGPTSAVPIIARFVWSHLRRRSDAPLIHARATAQELQIRYPVRATAPSAGRSWPLLLAALTLQPWSWQVLSTRMATDEIITVCPAS